MDQDAAYMVAASKVIENCNSFLKPQTVEGVEIVMLITSAEDKAQRRLKVKAMSTLMMGIPNEHQLKFKSIKDSKSLLEAIKKRFGSNDATKKTQRNLLKHEYENFTTSSSEILDQTFDRLQKLVIWRNKPDLDSMSMDDLYNNFKVYEPEVKGVSSSSTNTQNMTFVSSSSNNNTNSSNEAINIAFGVTTAGTYVNSANSTNIDNLSDAIIYAFLEGSSILMGMRLFPLIKPRWNVTISIRGANLQENVEHQEHKTTRTRRAQKGMCMLKLLTQLWCLVIDLEVMIEVTKLKKDLTMHLWHTSLQVLILREKDDIQLTVKKLKNASKSLNKLIDSQIADNYKKGLGYNAFLPPYTGLFMPPEPDLSYIGLEEFTSEPAVETLNAKTSEEVPKVVKKDNGVPIIKDWKSDDEDESVPQPKIEKKTVKPSVAKVEFVKPKQQSQNARKTAVAVNTARPVNTAHPKTTMNAAKPRPKAVVNTARPKAVLADKGNEGNPQMDLQDKRVIDSGCSRHTTWNMSYLTDYEENNRGYVTFGGYPKEGKITSKGTIKTGELDFENVYFVKELKFNLFSVSQIVPRKNNMYSVDLKNIIPKGGLTCLFEKATSDESRLWQRRLGHLNFKIMNKLVKGNLVRGLPSNIFENEQTCVACQKGKQHRASYHLGKFDGKPDEGFFIGYSLNSKAFRVFNSRTRIVEETLHIRFSENTPNNLSSGPNWLFDIDALTKTMNYQPVVAGIQSNYNAGTKDNNNASQVRKKKEPGKYYILLSLWTVDPPFPQEPKSSQDARFKPSNDVEKKVNEVLRQENECKDQEKSSIKLPDNPDMHELEDISIFEDSNEDVFGEEADLNNLESTFQVSPILTTRIHKDHPLEQVKENQEKDKNRIKTGQKQEVWRSREKFKVVVIERGRKTEENKKRMTENAYTYQKLFKFKEKKKREGPYVQFQEKKESIHLLLTGIGDEIYSSVDTCKAAHEMWIAIERLQQGKSLNKQDYQNEVNEICAEKIVKNENPLTLVVAAQQYVDTYYQALKSHKSYVPPSKQSSFTRSYVSTRHKGKEIAKPIAPPSELASKKDNDLEHAQRDKDMQKNLALITKNFKKIYKPTKNNLRTSSNTINKNVDTFPRYKNDNQTRQFGNQRKYFAKECRKPKRAKDYTYHKEKMLPCKQAEKGFPLQAKQAY
uniref:Uncharacterized protein n=1 Tax=Tanacetum cinerariifolium TaxID=118510 RepID=A0A6L2N982_TANCI|nr:hypothetical protein [Tanacetum cinerariifolium]